MYTHIYEICEKLKYDTSAIYQIKIKGELSGSLLEAFASVRVSLETTDRKNPITMLTGTVANQEDLLSILILIHKHSYPIIAVACIEIPKESHEVVASQEF